jgi:hypothetical protein
VANPFVERMYTGERFEVGGNIAQAWRSAATVLQILSWRRAMKRGLPLLAFRFKPHYWQLRR